LQAGIADRGVGEVIAASLQKRRLQKEDDEVTAAGRKEFLQLQQAEMMAAAGRHVSCNRGCRRKT
jgi:hypothetical protein